MEVSFSDTKGPCSENVQLSPANMDSVGPIFKGQV